MKLVSRVTYFVLSKSEESHFLKVSFLNSIEDSVKEWGSGTRISPIWQIKLSPEVIEPPQDFHNKSKVIFIGPVQPARVVEEVQNLSNAESIWSTLGCFNLLIFCGKDEAGHELASDLWDWAVKNNIPIECWSLDGGIVCDKKYQNLWTKSRRDSLEALSSHSELHNHPTLKPGFQENIVVSATCIERSVSVHKSLFLEVSAIIEANSKIIESFIEKNISVLEMQSKFLTMNAALSRFSSQAFSGTSPIRETECHFWIHSLLGTGSANLALSNFVSFIQKKVAEARFPERLLALEEINSDVPCANSILKDKEIREFDIISQTQDNFDNSKPIFPLVTYFSGRDGFSSYVQTLSAPLSTISECNSYRSNLLTVTHEVSHIFIQSALGVLSPTPGQSSEIESALELLEPHFQARNMLESARQLFLEAIVSIETEDRKNKEPYSINELRAEIVDIIENTRSEAQEILVHTFDFLYFHSGEPEHYIRSIWYSWCYIPNIGDRVPEYLMRTLCAVSANLLSTDPLNRFDAALKDTKRILITIKDRIDIENNYVLKVLTYIEKIEKEKALFTEVKRKYGVRMRLVLLVKIFLHSKLLDAELFQDPRIGGGEGYKNKKALSYNTDRIGNPLQFIRTHLKSNPTEVESMWVLHCLAFDLSPSPLGAS